MERASKTFVWLTMANFVAFAIGTFWFGGDAINGHVANGHYYLNSHNHLTEVSRALFAYSRWHTISVMVTIPIALLIKLSRRSQDEFAASQRTKNARNLRT